MENADLQKRHIPEVMTLNIVRILDRTGDLKTFHKNAVEHYKKYFPNLTNYENFMKATNKAIGFITDFVQVQLYLNRKNCMDNVFYIDLTPVLQTLAMIAFIS